jgi:hypothetical protein
MIKSKAAEYAAINVALELAQVTADANGQRVRVLVCSDPQSNCDRIEGCRRMLDVRAIYNCPDALQLESIVIRAKEIEEGGGIVDFMRVPAHKQLFANQVADSICTAARGFPDKYIVEPRLRLRRTRVILVDASDDSVVRADNSTFAEIRKRMRCSPATLSG